MRNCPSSIESTVWVRLRRSTLADLDVGRLFARLPRRCRVHGPPLTVDDRDEQPRGDGPDRVERSGTPVGCELLDRHVRTLERVVDLPELRAIDDDVGDHVDDGEPDENGETGGEEEPDAQRHRHTSIDSRST